PSTTTWSPSPVSRGGIPGRGRLHRKILPASRGRGTAEGGGGGKILPRSRGRGTTRSVGEGAGPPPHRGQRRPQPAQLRSLLRPWATRSPARSPHGLFASFAPCAATRRKSLPGSVA